MVGLPRSGKSTKAKKLAKDKGYVIVNPDSIRLALHGKAHDEDLEPYVWGITKTMVKSLFLAGHNDVILDATNVAKSWRDKWKSDSWKRKFHVVNTSEEICIYRALGEENKELAEVIKYMASIYEPVTKDERKE